MRTLGGGGWEHSSSCGEGTSWGCIWVVPLLMSGNATYIMYVHTEVYVHVHDSVLFGLSCGVRAAIRIPNNRLGP